MHGKRPDIQGLRAWAVIAVVIFHFFPSILPYGYFGVDVFFVLSGFLISMVLGGRPKCLSTYSNFYFKRLRRILPLALLIVLACIIAISLLVNGYAFSKGLKSAMYSMFFIKNFQPRASAEEDYFYALEHDNDFFTHFWSLCVEIQFYMIAPLLLHFCRPATDNTLANFSYMTVIAAGSLLYSLVAVPEEAFDFTPARLWQFLAGAMALHLDSILWRSAVPVAEKEQLLEEGEEKSGSGELPPSKNLALIVSTIYAAGCTAAVLYSGDVENVLRFGTTFVATFVLVARFKSVFLCHPLLEQLGDVSYSLYLIHWPIVCIFEVLDIDAWQCKLIGMTIAIVLSFISYYSYELRYLTLSTKATFLLVVMLYIACLSAVRTSTYLITEQGDKVTLVTSQLDLNDTRVLTQAEIDKENLQLSRDNKRIVLQGCTVRSGTGNNPFGFCDLKDGNGTLSFLMMGNSYVANLGGLVLNHFQPHYGKMMSRAIPQCEPLVPTKTDPYCRDYKAAHATFDADVDRERPDVLFLIARFIKPNSVPITGPVEQDELFQVMEKRLAFFEERVNKKIFILHAFTLARRPETLEKIMANKGLPMMQYMPEGIEADAKPMKERVKTLAERCKKCVVFDIEPAFLNEAGKFTVLNPQKLRYFDGPRHLNAIGKKQVDPVFEKLSSSFANLIQTGSPMDIVRFENEKV